MESDRKAYVPESDTPDISMSVRALINCWKTRFDIRRGAPVTHVPLTFGATFFEATVGAPPCDDCVAGTALDPNYALCEYDLVRWFDAIFDGTNDVFFCGRCKAD